jgi:PII-like signaling protein
VFQIVEIIFLKILHLIRAMPVILNVSIVTDNQTIANFVQPSKNQKTKKSSNIEKIKIII